MRILLLALISLKALSQVATPLIVTPGAGTASSEIRLRERRSNGDNYFGWKSPAALASDVMLIGPVDYGLAGQSLLTDGAGGTLWGSSIPVCASATGNDTYSCTISGFTSYTANSCVILNADTNNTGSATVNISGAGAKSLLRYGGASLVTGDIVASSPSIVCYNGTNFQLPPSASAGSGAWVNGGNSFGATSSIGNNDNYDLQVKTNNVVRLTIAAGGDAAFAGTVSAPNFDGAPALGTGNYVKTRKLDVADSSGGSSFWDLQSNSTAAESSIFARDNSGSRWLKGYRTDLSSPVNYTYVFSDWLPAKRDTTAGDAVTDAAFPSLGSTTRRWLKVWSADADINGTATIGALAVTGNTGLGGSLSFSGTATPLMDGLGTIGTSSYRYGAMFTYNLNASGTITFPTGAVAGYVWTSDGAGVGSWAVPGGIPVVDTTAIVKGSADATKLLRFELDGFSTATTRILTPQNADYTIAGTNIAQTFSAAQTFNSTLNAVSGLTVNGTLVISSSRDISNITSVAQNWVPNLSSYELGSSSTRWGKLWAAAVDVSGGLTVGGNVGLSGNMTFSGTATPLFDGLGSIGSSSYKYGSVHASSNYAYTGYYMGGTQVMDSSRNLTNIAAITTTGAITPGGGVATTSGGIGGTGHNTYYGGTWYYGVAAQTLNVTASGGGSCTITVYGGVITASTC